ncbi:primosomal replication protein N [Thalassotalea euphylliae]|uniref:Replication restart protein PriB n=1 Tax=Thalassotalea euphylliae TaxID=1655234 RepID=A0A3E0TUD5_9GAMM|nr:primosomal replication protein N [Thalassotalea euphylliae]REL28178.1 primosomal replication protein N [Thalassotalea euphylliae]
MTNSFVLVGNVVSPLKLSTSPAGVHHCQFSIEHRSIQVEDGLNRQAFVRMKVVATGEWSQRLASELIEGMQIQVTGFINRHESRTGNPVLALHAQQIEMI